MDEPRPREDRERQKELEQLTHESVSLLADQRLAEKRHEAEHAAFLARIRADLKVWIDEWHKRGGTGEDPEGSV